MEERRKTAKKRYLIIIVITRSGKCEERAKERN
jgi:hypothetical protein